MKAKKNAKDFFEKFDDIRYNPIKGWFEFEFDYTNFTPKAQGTKTRWTLCTQGNRIEIFSDEIDLTKKFEEHFSKYKIDINKSIKEAISAQTDEKFFEELLNLLMLTLQMRNSKKDSKIDYMISPVADEEGNFYDSRTCSSNLPENADANGAYNIARKGLWIVNQIKEAQDPQNISLFISNKDWLKFAQEKSYR